MSNILAYIKQYAENGFATFPTQKKRPINVGSWKENNVDLEPNIFRYPYEQFGVILKDEDLVVDIDPRNMSGRRVWSELKANLQLPESVERTMAVITGSKGMHIYLRKPRGLKINKNHKDYPGIDFLSAGSYVIGAGSVHENGNRYEPYNKLFSIAIAPPQLLDLIKRKHQKIDPFALVGAEEFRDEEDTIAMFLDYLKNSAPLAVEGNSGDKTTFMVACRGRDFNLTEGKTFELMRDHYNDRCSPPWDAHELLEKVVNAYKYNETPPGIKDPQVVFSDLGDDTLQGQIKPKWSENLDRQINNKDIIKPTFKNCVIFIECGAELRGKFRVNEFTDRLEVSSDMPWSEDRINKYNIFNDREAGHLLLYLAKRWKVEFNIDKIYRAVDVVAGMTTYHPIRDELDQITWDGVPRIDNWLHTYAGTLSTPYTRMIGRKTLVGMLGRVYDPGCKFDHVLILEGEQGIGKSTCCHILGGDYYGDAPIDIRDKDSIEYVHTHWVIELAELVSARKADVNRLKNFISRNEDDIRKPYMRSRERFPRQCVFIGTINPDAVGYLTDGSGNRRFWPVMCTNFELEKLRQDRDQLLAEARDCFLKGERPFLPQSMYYVAAEEAGKRVAIDPWSELIAEWVDNNPDVGEIRTSEIFQNILGGSRMAMHTGHSRRIADIMRTMGWKKNVFRGHARYIKPLRMEPVNEK